MSQYREISVYSLLTATRAVVGIKRNIASETAKCLDMTDWSQLIFSGR